MGYNGQIRSEFFDLFCGFVTVHAGHFYVHEHQIDFGVMPDKFYSFPSIDGVQEGEGFGLQDLVEEDGADFIIFDDENTAGSCLWAVGMQECSGQLIAGDRVVGQGDGEGCTCSFN